MKNLLLAAASVAVLAGGASAAHAQDSTWTGFYAGVSAGGVFQPDHDDETVLFDTNLNGTYGDTILTTAPANAFSPGFNGSGAALTTAPGGGVSGDKNGYDIAARIGYDWQYGSWVFGGLADFAAYNTTDSVSAYSTTPANYVMTRELTSAFAVRGRLGYVWGPYLPYITGGYARGQVDHSFTTTNTANVFTQSGADNSLNGYQAGLGVERHFDNSKWTLGAEYLYTSFDDDEYTIRAANTGSTPAANPFIQANAAGTDFRRSEDKFAIHSVRLTLGYRF